MTMAPLAARLREATWPSHRLAERTGFMVALLAGRLDRAAYALLLRNLEPLYVALESGLERHAADPVIAPFRRPAIYRAPALRADLAHIAGPGWATLPLMPAALAYVERLGELAAGWPAGLLAHAYVRYMGDLSGGRLVGAVVRRKYATDVAAATAFFEYGPGFDADATRQGLREGFDAAPLAAADATAVVGEAVEAFGRHARLFDELRAAVDAR
jgi:heme oxygenase